MGGVRPWIVDTSVSPETAPGRTKRKKTIKTPSISKLIKEADRLFSINVRNLGAGQVRTSSVIGGKILQTNLDNIFEGNQCFTCRRFYPTKKLHCGHYLSRYYKAARWNYDNARPQCMMCNMWKRGDPVVFRRNLINEIGIERVEAVEKLRDAPIKLSPQYLATLIEQLKSPQI